MSSSDTGACTAAEYLELERKALEKHEYYRGKIFAMSGASRQHARISGNIYRHLRNQLEGMSCEPFIGGLRLKVAAADYYTYPDVSVVSGPLEFEDGTDDTLLNPTVIFEVLSPTTGRRDRTFKFGHYLKQASIREILLVWEDALFVEQYTRSGTTWYYKSSDGSESSVDIACIDCSLTMAQIYQNVEFPIEQSLSDAQ